MKPMLALSTLFDTTYIYDASKQGYVLLMSPM
jgi:hypothetical protein